MPAHVVLDITVIELALFEEHKILAPAAIEAYGGRSIARGRKAEALKGDRLPNRTVVLEFKSSEVANKWLDLPEYREARSMRLQAAAQLTVDNR